jgi:hypothetical protein
MNKLEMRKAIQDGLKVYFESGKAVTKYETKVVSTKTTTTNNSKSKKEVQIDKAMLPTSLKIRFGWME